MVKSRKEIYYNTYEDTGFENDREIADEIVRKKFGYYKRFHDDLLQVCMVNLWHWREKYFDPSKGSYEIGAKVICTQTIIRATRSEQWRFENSYIPLDLAIDENGEIAMIDTINILTEPEKHAIQITEGFNDVHYEAMKLKNFKKTNTKTQEILSLFFEGFTEEEVAKKVGCRRQYVTSIKKKYKEAYVEIRNKIDEEIKNIC